MKSPFYSISSSPSGRGLKLAIIINIILHYTSTVAFESLLQLPASGSSLNRPSRIRVLHLNAFGAVGNGLHDDTEVNKPKPTSHSANFPFLYSSGVFILSMYVRALKS